MTVEVTQNQSGDEVVGKNGKLLAGPAYLKLLVPNPVEENSQNDVKFCV